MVDVNSTQLWDNVSTASPISESIIPPILQFLFGVVGNILALTILCCTAKTHEWKPFYRLVAGLAVTDFCGIMFVYPAVLTRYSSGFTYIYPKALCDHIAFMFSFAFMGSAFIVTALSFDRFLAILFPFTYNWKKELRTNVMLITVWVLSALLSALPLMGVGSTRKFYPGSWCFINFASNDARDQAMIYIYTTVGISILIATVLFNTATIMSVCRTCLSKDRSVLKGTIQNKHGAYIVVLLLGIVMVFSICWVPLMIHMIVNVNKEQPGNGSTELLVIRLAITNSNVDPWVYILLRKENLRRLLLFIRKTRSALGLPLSPSSTGVTDSTTHDRSSYKEVLNYSRC